MCSDQSPWQVDEDTAYGFAAVNIAGGSESSWCCACYELTFTSTAIAGKKMIVQATNTGGDLGSNQFDLAVRAFSSLSAMTLLTLLRSLEEALVSTMAVLRNGVLRLMDGARNTAVSRATRAPLSQQPFSRDVIGASTGLKALITRREYQLCLSARRYDAYGGITEWISSK